MKWPAIMHIQDFVDLNVNPVEIGKAGALDGFTIAHLTGNANHIYDKQGGCAIQE
jgi:hypothetical protein